MPGREPAADAGVRLLPILPAAADAGRCSACTGVAAAAAAGSAVAEGVRAAAMQLGGVVVGWVEREVDGRVRGVRLEGVVAACWSENVRWLMAVDGRVSGGVPLVLCGR